MKVILQSDRGRTLRTIVFAAMAAAVLLGLAFGLVWARPRQYGRQRADLYRRGGDTFVRMFYLARAAGWEEEGSHTLRGRLLRLFVESAQDQYLLSCQADPASLRSAVSLALMLAARGRKQEAQTMLGKLVQREIPLSQRNALSRTFALIYATHPRAEDVEKAADFLRGFAPGRAVLAKAYEEMGRQDLADREWSAAEAEGISLANRVLGTVAVCGLMVLAGVIGLIAMIVGRIRRRAALRQAQGHPERSRGAATGARPAEGRTGAKWGVREAVEALILWIFLQMACGVLLAVAMPAERELGIIPVVASSVLSGGVALLWVWVASGRGGGLGWGWGRGWSQAAIGVSAAGVCAVPMLAVQGIFQQLLGQGIGDEAIVRLVVGEPGWQGKAVVLLALCAAVPAVEETLFRGVLYGALRRHWAFGPAALGSAAVFAVGHLSLAGAIPYLLLGLVFAYLYERSGSLVAPWVAHGAFNAFNLAILWTLFG